MIFTNSLSGFYKFRNELLKDLTKIGFHLILCAPYDDSSPYKKNNNLTLININFQLKSLNPFHDLFLLFNFIKIINLFKPNLLLTYTIKPNIFGGLASRLTKTKHIANITGLGSTLQTKSLIGFLVKKMYLTSLKKTKLIFFQNSDNMKKFKDFGFSGTNFKLISGSGVNIKKFKYLKYPDNRNIQFLFIGRIMKDKGIDLFLNSAKFFSNKYSNVVFHVAGPMEEDYNLIFKEYSQKNYIKYHGKIKDIRNLLKISHAIINPTFHEGMSNVLLESLSSGRPVIASNIPGCIETFDNEISGLLFEVNNQQSLNTTIEKFIKIPYPIRKRMGVFGRKKVVKAFNRVNITKEYSRSIINLIGL